MTPIRLLCVGKPFPLVLLLLVLLVAGGSALHAADGKKDQSVPNVAGKTATGNIDEDTMRFEGEKRYSANCGRCHQPPHKLPPRVMATVIRHMRVRATLTDGDMRYILWYMTQ